MKRAFRANGYPQKLLERTLNQPPASQDNRRLNQSDPTVESKPKTLCLPYIRGLLEEIQRLCGGLNLKANNTLRNLLTRVKKQLPMERLLE